MSSPKKNTGAVLSSKTHTAVLMASKITQMEKHFQAMVPKRVLFRPSNHISRLNPEVDSLFQRPKDESLMFNPEKDEVWFEKKF